MSGWEYKVVPAPTKGVKARGIKGADGRFAHALENLMNEMASDGWEFQRAETLPSVERSGLTGSTTEWRNMMVFRRAVSDQADAFEHELLPAPAPAARVEPAFTAPSKITDDTAEGQISDDDTSLQKNASLSDDDDGGPSAVDEDAEQSTETDGDNAATEGDTEQNSDGKSKS